MSIRFVYFRSEFRSWISLLIFCLVDLSNIDSEMLKSPTIIVWESKSLCKSLRTCLMYLGAPALDPYIFRILYQSFYHYVMSFFVSFDLRCFKFYFIRDENCNSCFFFALHLLGKSSSIPLFCVSLRILCVSLHVSWVSWIQHTNVFWLFIQFASLCHLIGKFSPFTFRVNIVMCEFDLAILMLAGCFAH